MFSLTQHSALRGGLWPHLPVFLPQHLRSIRQGAAVSQNAGACGARACSCTTSRHETREVTSSQLGISDRVFAYLKHLILTKSGSFRSNNTHIGNDTAKWPERKTRFSDKALHSQVRQCMWHMIILLYNRGLGLHRGTVKI